VAEERIKITVGVEGVEKSVRQFQQLSGGMQAANDNYKNLSVTASKAAATMGAFGGALRPIIPQLGEFGAAVSRSSGAIGAMTAVLGGPGGLLVGGAVAVIGIFASALKEARERSEELSKAERERAKVIKETAEAQEAANRKLVENLGKSSDVIALEEKLLEARRKRAEFGAGTFDLGGGASIALPGTAERTPFQQKGVAALDAEIARLEKALAEARKNKPTGGTSRDFINYQEGAALAGSQGDLAALESQADYYKRAQDAVRELQKQQIADEVKAIRDKNAEILDSNRQSFDETLALARENDAALAAIDDQKKKRWDEIRSAGIGAFTAVGANALTAFNQMAKGAKMSARAFLEMIGDTIFAQGQGHFFLGMANAFIPGMQASSGPLMAVGGAEMAFGTLLGAAMARSGSKGGGGGGGRAESPRSMVAGNGTSGPSTVVVNVHGLVVGTTADLGAVVVGSMREGVRRGTISRGDLTRLTG